MNKGPSLLPGEELSKQISPGSGHLAEERHRCWYVGTLQDVGLFWDPDVTLT